MSGSINEFLDVFGENTIKEINRAMKIIKESGKYSGLAGGDWNYILIPAKGH